MEVSPSYPAELERYERLLDGSVVRLRPIRPDDGARLLRFHQQLSDRTVYLRFFSAHPRLSEDEVRRFTHVDYHDRLAIVAEEAGEFIAVARYDRLAQSDEAELAFVVEDRHQHRGLGSLLLEQLADAARERGVNVFCADTLAENRTMLTVFLDAGYTVRTRRDGDTVHVRFDIEPSEASLEARRARHARREKAPPRPPPPPAAPPPAP